ncbi:unnamed protein product, partial [Porites evermanni]
DTSPSSRVSLLFWILVAAAAALILVVGALLFLIHAKHRKAGFNVNKEGSLGKTVGGENCSESNSLKSLKAARVHGRVERVFLMDLNVFSARSGTKKRVTLEGSWGGFSALFSTKLTYARPFRHSAAEIPRPLPLEHHPTLGQECVTHSPSRTEQ